MTKWAFPLRIALAAPVLAALASGAVADDTTPESEAARLYQTYACSTCHGDTGKALVDSFPNLAGLNARYIETQVNDIVSGARTGAIDASGSPRAEMMRSALVDAAGAPLLRADEVKTIANWLARLPPIVEGGGSVPAERVKRGAQLYVRKMCASCHGAEGRRPTSDYPHLAGQQGPYLAAQLADFRDRARTNGRASVMTTVLGAISDEEIGLLADYLTQIAPAVAARSAAPDERG